MKNNIHDLEDLSTETMEGTSINNNFIERSEIAQEIINTKPDFIEKWALLFFLLLLVALTAAAWFIKYPEVIEASAVLTGNNAPKEIIPRQSGRLTGLFVKNDQLVEQGEAIARIESVANPKEASDLSKKIDSSISLLAGGKPEKLAVLFSDRLGHLGELQSSYQTFIAAWQQFNDYTINGFYDNKKSMLYNDISALQIMRQKIISQKDYAIRDNELAKTTLEMNEKLYNQKVISEEEYRQAESQYTNKLLRIPQLESSIIAHENQIREKEKEIKQLTHDIELQQKTFEQALYTLKSNTDDWLNKYIIHAPVRGNVIFVLPLQNNQFVEQGKLLGYINPQDSRYYAEIKLPQNNFGKVDTGMKVQLRLAAYPYQEVGFLSGTLNYISTVSVDSGFLGTVRLNSGLLTSQNKRVQFKNGLKAKAIITIKDMRLLERLYYDITKSMDINQ